MMRNNSIEAQKNDMEDAASNFWEGWESPTDIEKRAIESVIKARDAVIASVPNDALVAIYIKGSFARREMKDGSDVDMVPIVTEDAYQGAVFGVNTPDIDPVCVVPLSISEFKNNKLSSEGDHTPDLRAEPDLFLLKLKEYKLIYGTPLHAKDYLVRETRQIVRDEIEKMKDGYIKAYQEGVVGFDPLLKEVFWLVEWVQKLQENAASHSFEGIANSIRDKHHIIYDALELRKNNRNQEDEKIFISKLEEYLDELETQIQ